MAFCWLAKPCGLQRHFANKESQRELKTTVFPAKPFQSKLKWLPMWEHVAIPSSWMRSCCTDQNFTKASGLLLPLLTVFRRVVYSKKIKPTVILAALKNWVAIHQKHRISVRYTCLYFAKCVCFFVLFLIIESKAPICRKYSQGCIYS